MERREHAQEPLTDLAAAGRRSILADGAVRHPARRSDDRLGKCESRVLRRHTEAAAKQGSYRPSTNFSAALSKGAPFGSSG